MAGLLEWSNAIRFTMENDPGRENFQSQLDTHGFIFLDDYLENILSGPCQDPIIELVKTPGRKKMICKKPKGLGLSGSRTVASLRKIDSNEEQKLEEKTTPPLNSLDKVLFQATGMTTLNAGDRLLSRQIITSDKVIAFSGAFLSSQTPQTAVDSSTSDSLTPDRLHQNDLSIIAEDDENAEPKTRSQRNSGVPPSPALHNSPKQYTCESHGRAESGQPVGIAESSSDIFHSITLDSPSPQVSTNAHNLVIPRSSPTEINKDLSKTNTLTPNASLLDTALGQSKVELPDTHALDLNMGSREFGLPSQDLGPAPPSGDKYGVALFPTLPAPIPLRKSVRTSRDPSVGTGHTGSTTPGVLQGGKRTSWLKKAREVKALEVTTKHAHTNTALLDVTGAPSENVLKRKSAELLVSPETIAPKDPERNLKSVKSNETDEAPLKAMPEFAQLHHKTSSMVNDTSGQDGMLDRFKRTVEDLGAKVGKNISKSVGAAAATSALAEARAAAEARVVERIQKEEEMTRISGSANLPALAADVPALNRSEIPKDKTFEVPSSEERRLSISELLPPADSSAEMRDGSSNTTDASNNVPTTASLVLDQLRGHTSNHQKSNRENITMTPPDSPSTSRHTSSVLPEVVFGKHPPVFIPPVSANNMLLQGPCMGFPSTCTFSLPVSMPLGLQLPPSPKHTDTLSRQSTVEDVQPDEIFDDTSSAAWMPETQDTDYSPTYELQSHIICQTSKNGDDGSLTKEGPTGIEWTNGDTVKEDIMTWSTSPSQSQREDTGRLALHQDRESRGNELDQRNTLHTAPGIYNHSDLVAHGDSDLDDIIVHGQSTIGLVEKAPQSDYQVSMTASQSTRSHAGLSGQTSRPLGSALGASKKGNHEVKKVLQMAAAAAKKQQGEDDKKAARLKEMESRRQLAMQRKAEEIRSRTLEQERKVREEGERRKREREENTDKRQTKAAVRKDDDNGKKRKIASIESQRREAKKPLMKPVPKSSSLKPPSALGSSTAYNVSLQTVANPSTSNDSRPLKPPVVTASTAKGKTPTTPSATTQDNLSQPSQLVQIQMAARAKAQIQTANLTSEPQVTSESIELPEINSEYSDSDDEDRSKALPGWAQSPELRQALQLQSTINPDDIFGAIRPLRMEEMFKNRTSLFRARTSSANWTGTDRLTMEEEKEYAKRMGFK